MSYSIRFMVDEAATGGAPLEVFESRDLTYNYYDLLRHLGIADYLSPRENDNKNRLGALLPVFEEARAKLQAMSSVDARALIRGGGSWGTQAHILSELGIIIDRARRYPNLYLHAD